MEQKEKAVLYIKSNKIDTVLQQTLNNLFKTQPENIYGYLCNELGNLSSEPTVKMVSGFSAMSRHGMNERVSVEISCTVNNETQVTGEALMGYKNNEDSISLDDLKAVNDCLQGLSLFDQKQLDEKLEMLEISDSMKLSVSTALLKSSSTLSHSSVFDSLRRSFNESATKSPLPIVTLIHCGKNGPGKLNLGSIAICPSLGKNYKDGMELMNTICNKVEELVKKKLLLCVATNGAFSLSCDKPEQMFELVKEAALELELTLGSDFHLVLDCRAEDFHTEVVPGQGSAKKGQTQSTSKHRYEFIEGQVKPTEDVCDFLESLVESENIIGFVDPLHHEDVDGYEKLLSKVGSKCVIFSRSPTPHSKPVFSLGSTITSSLTPLSHLTPSSTVIEPLLYEEGETALVDLALAYTAGFTMFGGLRGVRAGLYNRMSRLLDRYGEVETAVTEWDFVQPTTPDQDPAPE